MVLSCYKGLVVPRGLLSQMCLVTDGFFACADAGAWADTIDGQCQFCTDCILMFMRSPMERALRISNNSCHVSADLYELQ